MKVKKTDLPVMPPEDILPSLDDEADESDMDDGKYNFDSSNFSLLYHTKSIKSWRFELN